MGDNITLNHTVYTVLCLLNQNCFVNSKKGKLQPFEIRMVLVNGKILAIDK